MFTSEQIKSAAPLRAYYFRLKLLMSNGTERLFPLEPGAFFKVGEPPEGAPDGEYALCFYTEDGLSISHPEKKLTLASKSEIAPRSQLSLPFRATTGRPSAPGLHGPTGPSEVRRDAISREPAPTPIPEPLPLTEFDREYRQQLHALDLEERQQEFIKNSTYVTEVAELFTVNRLMRREMLELHRIIVQHSARAYKDIDHVKGTVHELLDLQKAVLEHAATQIVKAPAPPPDYVGLGHSALSVVKELGVALLQRAQAARDTGSTLRDPRPFHQLTAPKAEVGPPPPAAPSDVLAKMIAKLQNTTELDLAMAMSSPDSWKALLDSLRASPENNDGAPAASTPPSAPNEEPSP